jgi:hypothetical protein
MIPLQLHRRIPLIRRPFWQRDQALTERDAAHARFAEASLERDAALRLLKETNETLEAERERLHPEAELRNEPRIPIRPFTLPPEPCHCSRNAATKCNEVDHGRIIESTHSFSDRPSGCNGS